MYRKSIYPYIILLLCTLLSSCKEDDCGWMHDDIDGGLPVEFSFQWPGLTETRSFDDATVKTKFGEGDVIHIVGTFKTSALQADGSHEEGKVARYGALRYNSETRQWEAVAGNKLTWPSIAVSGKFYAYYVSGANGLITEVDKPIQMSLSEVTPQSDPLMAPETNDIVYGHAVNLQFRHLCAYLTLTDMEPMVASDYFFVTPTVKDFETGKTRAFTNAFQLTLVENDGSDYPELAGDPALRFEFITVPDPNYEDLVYISGNATMSTFDDIDGEEKSVSKVGYFLEPGYYDSFELLYPKTAPETYRYLTYSYDDIPANVGGVVYDNTPPNLEAGITYTLSITRSPGVKIENPPTGDGWDDEGPDLSINVPAFLEAIRNGTDYRNEDDVLILEKTADGTKLLYNVDFNNFPYKEFMELGFKPDVQEGRVFDGNQHYISNLGSPLFRNNYGTIKNVGIRNVKFHGTSLELSLNVDETDLIGDKSRHGALCMWNRSTAEIQNVRVADVNMEITVEYQNTAPDGYEVHNVGCVVGSNTGAIKELYLGGNFSLTVDGTEVKNAEVLIGGILGQNAGNGNVYDISLYKDDFNMNIKNACNGTLGLYAVGGIVGKSSGFITGVILSNVNIDGKSSSGVVSYMGGMAGQLDVSTGSSATLNSCIVGGQVASGTTKATTSINGQSYIGGMVGYDVNVPVTGCRAAVSVLGAETAYEKVIYGTGGAFGRIQNPSVFENLISYGTELKAPPGNQNDNVVSNYIGNFAGIGPANQTWDDYANNNIILHSFGTLPPIGIFMGISN